MGKEWDGGDIAFRPETWRLVYDVLKPGAHLLAFSGTRTYHRMVCAIEDAGFEIRDQFAWLYGCGFPKSHDVSKAIDKSKGATRTESLGKSNRHGGGIAGNGTSYELPPEVPEIYAPATPEAVAWQGWGTAVKPALEPIVLARKPLDGTVAHNVLTHGCGGLNIDGCRIDWPNGVPPEVGTPGWGGPAKKLSVMPGQDGDTVARTGPNDLGRFPANVLHDGSPDVLAAFDNFGEKTSGKLQSHPKRAGKSKIGTFDIRDRTGEACNFGGDTGSASRFFYSAKADKADRADSKHPTVKPTDLMRYLVRLVTPPGGTVLDPFAGTGSTLLAADQLGFNAVGIEADPTYHADAIRKLQRDAGLFADIAAD
jgi:site-specific DNA-methyltransferase (adenine-specific)